MDNELKALGFKDLSYLMYPGIYVLLLNGEIVYVGQTRNIFGRFNGPDHRHRSYDKVYFVRCNPAELDRVEALMILKLKPKERQTYNFNNNTDPRNKPITTNPGSEPAIHHITVGKVQLAVKGMRRL